MATRFYLTLPDPELARGKNGFGFHSHGAAGFAQELQDALRNNTLFKKWRNQQDDPDAIDPMMGATDPDATVTGEQRDLHIDLVATTVLKGDVLKHRLSLLAGSHWQLRDVTAA
ncbi:hypothetical protein [Solilutibacter silvestris]|uniref:Uncharacterized protein n=1 Tax=Solilutibacter silvestris TaxID=1645665 RepID=A0A2K1Q1M1_9GAMM|nr:hypothetical protein [Lysobacter silvestris]PNS08948.1 hypothetical protein Lysil_0577 [Lysobacter silvestris]